MVEGVVMDAAVEAVLASLLLVGVGVARKHRSDPEMVAAGEGP